MHEFWQQLPINLIGVLTLIIFNHMKNKQKDADDALKELSREIQGLRRELADQSAEIGKLQLEFSYLKSPFRNNPSS